MESLSTCPTIWLIDDDEDDRLLLESAFQSVDPSIELLLLPDGEEVLPILAQCSNTPRLILLDINMPGKNGFDTLRDLRSHPVYGQLPVIMLTTSADEADRRRSLLLGATHFLTKPLTFSQLKQLAQVLIQEWELV